MSTAMDEGEGPAPQGDGAADTQENKMRTFMEEMGLTDMPAQDAVMKEVEAKYEEECAKLRARAERFKTEFKPPNKWDKFKHEIRMAVRNMKTRPIHTGGIDIDSTEERARIEARSLKFQGSTPEVQQRLDKEREEKEREEKRAAREARFGKQAGPGYDVRVFPQIFQDLHIDPRKIYCASSQRNDIRDEQYHSVIPTRVHLFTSDSPSFLKLRSPDILRFFTGYQPQYVEWLGANSCNIYFQDEPTARRALKELSVELPPWEPLRRDLYGDENAKQNRNGHRRQRPVSAGLDISPFKWRLGTQRLVKKYSNEHGPAGTSVVVLMRLATSADVFDSEKSKKKYEAIQTYKEMAKGDGSVGAGGAPKRERPKLRRPTFISDDKAEAPAQQEALEEEPSRIKRRRRGEADSDSDDDGMEEDREEEATMEEEGEQEADKGVTEHKDGSAAEGTDKEEAGMGDTEVEEEEEAQDLEAEYADLL